MIEYTIQDLRKDIMTSVCHLDPEAELEERESSRYYYANNLVVIVNNNLEVSCFKNAPSPDNIITPTELSAISEIRALIRAFESNR